MPIQTYEPTKQTRTQRHAWNSAADDVFADLFDRPATFSRIAILSVANEHFVTFYYYTMYNYTMTITYQYSLKMPQASNSSNSKLTPMIRGEFRRIHRDDSMKGNAFAALDILKRNYGRPRTATPTLQVSKR